MSRIKTTPEFISLVCKTCRKSFNVLYKLRNKRTYCSKKCANHDPDVIKKIISSQAETYSRKYGMHPMKTQKTKENLKNSFKTKYGVDWNSKISGWSDKMKATKKEKYGNENYTNRELAKQTCLLRYGVSNPAMVNSVSENINQTKRNNHFNYLTTWCESNNLILQCKLSDYKGYHWSNTYSFQCKTCNYLFNSSVYNLNYLYCEKCNPNKKETLENNFFDFLSSLTPQLVIKRRDRTILYGKELDFYLPDKKLAIEINGLYWHSENGCERHKNYHLNKMKGCIAHGIRLIHIFENEWRDKPELIKSIIKTILNYNTNIIYGRKCEIKEVPIKEKDEFLTQNHLQGKDKSTIKLGLYYKNNLVSLMTFRKTSRFDKKAEWELSRFCNITNTIIIGGASKLFSCFIKNWNPISIVSYSDRRYFSGELYSTLGFQLVATTPPSYHYISSDYKLLFNRMNFQKHLLNKKLSNFNKDISEWENMKSNGWDRIWDCGNIKWIWKK